MVLLVAPLALGSRRTCVELAGAGAGACAVLLDEAHPYASGQHRGIDIGADAAGETVVAPATGTVSFAGTVPTSGKSVTIATADGYSVTLTHLGSIVVVKGAMVTERAAVGTVGPSGTAEVAGPYVHLGIRVAADTDGYVDPLGLLPPAADGSAAANDPPASQLGSSGTSSGASGSTPSTPPPSVAASTPAATTRGSSGAQVSPGAPGQGHKQADERPSERGPTRSSLRPVVRAGERAELLRTHREAPVSRPGAKRAHAALAAAGRRDGGSRRVDRSRHRP